MLAGALGLLLFSGCVDADTTGGRLTDDGRPGNGSGRDEPPCGRPGASEFDVTVWDVVAFPTKPNGDPWDWDGQIPDWLFDAIADLQWGLDIAEDLGLLAVSPDLATFSAAVDAADEITRLIDEHAPELLGGTVPPDLCVEGGYLAEDQWIGAGYTDYHPDSYVAPINTVFQRVAPTLDERFVLWVYDHDLAFDDDVGGWSIDRAFMREVAGCGPYALVDDGPGGLHMMVVEVE